MWKKMIIWITAFTLLFPAAAGAAKIKTGQQPAQPVVQLETTAQSAVLMEANSGQILYEKNMHQALPPASVTKIMTLLVAVEAVEQGKVKLEDRIKASENAAGMGGSQIYLEPGEEMTLKDLLISIAVGSANDACVAVAEHVAGSHEAFVEMMNQKLKDLGLKDSKFVNAYGLPAEGHVASAYDLAMILREGMKHPLFRELTSIKEYDLRGGEFKLYNTNKLLWWYNGADTGKTGWTTEAKYCLASSAQRDGLRLIAVVMATPEPRSHFRESIKLYNYGFARYKAVNISQAGQVQGVIPVSKGQVKQVKAVSQEPVVMVVEKGQEKKVTYKVEIPARVQAPIKKGQKIGKLIIMFEGQPVKIVDLVAAREVEAATLNQHFGAIWQKATGIK
ncbi:MULTISPECIES: D-alanyl-D-alanine carboxypeptidase family protein [Carboxydocella]|uniref:serine-type D-Ala-D-Ala carboxypeptidase n=2 Tax=Carboxydocella TaxID=178898 RepID=A0A1T4MU18_9FIRM|nr:MULTISPECIES: D-alanyl-D-alanine carboxypeptidase family protein [Carboxydocella]AVX20333.1 D-alanyl-D-alanine carboxypeptidase (penicillin-binding protein 5/6) [Carboxydocella thermautotrophica]AVX30757.1 D-alanyl-D-alanine carboxypeptidase (penicillin-binding protein 5/6) [Carboxydocella thermautotrophica]GAW30096.1 D-alanyl-D-alanine carboxypeptidase [Carboxydocella sp. ULO1]SJZ70317.1 D-alanyl-D-alanine carboxypeptidase (penicillin-binding protein 5/6) [Carboxydocella sporoproducens DSM 